MCRDQNFISETYGRTDVRMKNEKPVLGRPSWVRQQIQDTKTMKLDNQQLRQQLMVQEEETVKAMKAIENQLEFETNKVIKLDEESVDKNDIRKVEIIEKQYQKKLLELKQEKDKIMEDMVKMQAEKDLATEKSKVTDKQKKYEHNLKLFNVLVENRHEQIELPIPEEEKKHDECIMSALCEGGCENVSQLKRLSSLKQLGNNRSCPQSKL